MDNYYIISSDDRDPANPHSPRWPKMIGISFESKKVIVAEGKGHGLQGTRVSFDKFRAKDWEDIFLACDAEWLLDEIQAKGGITCFDENDFHSVKPAHFDVVKESR